MKLIALIIFNVINLDLTYRIRMLRLLDFSIVIYSIIGAFIDVIKLTLLKGTECLNTRFTFALNFGVMGSILRSPLRKRRNKNMK